jgi:plastocyanin
MKTASKITLLLVILGAWGFPCQADEVVGVKIEKMQFVPQNLKIRVGTTVTWINMEKYNNHSVFFQQEGLPESDRLFPGETWQRVFDKPGTFPYLCGPHPEMTGTVEVAP